MIRTAIPWCLGLCLLGSGMAAAQGFNFGGDNDAPVQVSADEGIEWQSEGSRVIARGHARAVRGPMSVVADSLTAYYRHGQKGDEIWRIDADGNVVIANATEKATGHKATYDLDKAVVVLTGTPARLTTPTDDITATEALEYWEQKRMAVARGDAHFVQRVRQQKLRADVLVAYFDAAGKKGQDLSRADAFGNVEITSPRESAHGDKGTYDARSGMATLAGKVRLTREGNSLEGGYVQMNLNSGISKIFPAIPGTEQADSKVRGNFIPDKKRAEATFSGPSSPGSDKTAGEQNGR